ITKQEAAVMLARAARLCGMDTTLSAQQARDTLSQFNDYRTAAAWAQNSLAFCYREGILDETDAEIRPLSAARRCNVAAMVYRMMTAAALVE
ncbi:MAG: hypothetical protein LBU77_04970, partial [Clostridiales bacterium]|nr:hypothetical protein [Clostridiales bacterium]